jgi:hypothetical protein
LSPIGRSEWLLAFTPFIGSRFAIPPVHDFSDNGQICIQMQIIVLAEYLILPAAHNVQADGFIRESNVAYPGPFVLLRNWEFSGPRQ